MEEIKKILVALAFSDHVKELFDYSAKLAHQLEASLIVASIINVSDVEAVRKITAMGYDVNGEHYVESIRKEREEILDQIILASGFPAEKIQRILKVGKPVNELLRIMIEKNVDLVVMGIKEHSELEHFLVGSVAEKLFRRSPVPVISFRSSEQAERLKNRIHL
jgi:nucleotide-binding universal stress UspA family protein